MSELRAAYHSFIGSSLQQAACTRSIEPDRSLAKIREYWNLDNWEDSDLVQVLAQLNQCFVATPTELMHGGWMPYRYDARTQSIYWCLPDGPAQEPFHDEYISRCLQRQVLNHYFRPRTSLVSMQGLDARMVAQFLGRQPVGFIFHLSRCGSTLVSGCLSELDGTMVLSEPPVLTELMLDFTLSGEEKSQAIRGVLTAIAQAVPSHQKLVIKWNAWDLLQWDLLHDLYPQVPCVLLVRDPIEILASHHRQCGRHMSGDPALAQLAPVFALRTEKQPFISMLHHRIGVLQVLMTCMHDMHRLPVLRYDSLNIEALAHISHSFGIFTSNAGYARMATRLEQHAKALDQRFEPDGAFKMAVFEARDRLYIQSQLGDIYMQLLQRASSLHLTEAIDVA